MLRHTTTDVHVYIYLNIYEVESLRNSQMLNLIAGIDPSQNNAQVYFHNLLESPDPQTILLDPRTHLEPVASQTLFDPQTHVCANESSLPPIPSATTYVTHSAPFSKHEKQDSPICILGVHSSRSIAENSVLT